MAQQKPPTKRARVSAIRAKRSPAKADTRKRGPSRPTDAQPDEETALPSFMIVGIGASAGGLEACGEFLDNLPAKTGMAFVLVQHLAPKHTTALPDLLGAHSSIPVVQVTNGMDLEPNQLHVIPPGVAMTVSDGKLRLSPRPSGHAAFSPIDQFFRSLSQYAQTRSIGVVLSGTASDGAFGLREIKAAGGITIAQDPQTAKYDGMPRAAIATGAVDLVRSPADIARELARIARHPLATGLAVKALQPDSATKNTKAADHELRQIFAMLRSATGVDFTHYKQPTIRRRLHRRMVLHKIERVDRYIKFMEQNPPEIHALYQDLLIHVTSFFREPDSFAVLSKKVWPKVMANRQPDAPIRVWLPGCSTGEEAYSVAIALLEFLEGKAGSTPIQIFATDISEAAIERARAGLYPESISADVSPERLRRFFTKSDGHWRINKKVRDLCVFARQDLARDPPFSRLDLIVCRNVLIYLGPLLQKRLMRVFHYALKPHAFLMLGAAETIGTYTDLFSGLDKRHRVYLKTAAGGHVGMDLTAGELTHSDTAPGAKPKPLPISAAAVQNEASRVILNRYSPPGVVVDNDLQIIQFRGQTGAFLEPAAGDATLGLLKMAREGLLYPLRSALQEARRNDASVRKDKLNIKADGEMHEVSIEVIPLEAPGNGRHFLVLFDDKSRSVSIAHPEKPGKPGKASKGKEKQSKAGAERVRRLQEELAASREYLQSIIQDLEGTNEELQSANEEILSSNEELQSTNEELDTAKEELQSTNEELNTINEELSARNEELSRVNSDLINLLASVQIAIVMVAGDLRIRRFTPMAERVLNLIPADVGRPISDIKPNIDVPDLEKLIADAIDTVTIKEQEVRDRHGNWFMLRIRPYKSIDNQIDGAVLALFDIEEQKRRSADELSGSIEPLRQDARDVAGAIVETLSDPLIVLDARLTVVSVNRAFRELFQVVAAESEGRRIYELGNGQWNIPSLRLMLEDVLPAKRTFADFEVEHDFPALGRRKMRLSARRIERGTGNDPLILLGIKDMTDPRNRSLQAKMGQNNS